MVWVHGKASGASSHGSGHEKGDRPPLWSKVWTRGGYTDPDGARAREILPKTMTNTEDTENPGAKPPEERKDASQQQAGELEKNRTGRGWS